MATKFVFITGGVVSSLGKGITAAALGRLLKCRGYSVSVCKLDPYLNVDPGTMNPYQHGEVYVTDDGAETDLDIGHYERFIDEKLSRDNNATSGQIYQTVIERERAGGYNGGTVQIIPHITDEIQARVMRAAARTNPDVLIVEIGGTVGDIEGQPFLEAIRQIRWSVGPENSTFIHVTLIPYLHAAGELKSKPTQHSVKELLSIGIQPDILVCRSEMPVGPDLRGKIARFCNVDADCVIENLNAPSLYSVPLMLEEEGLCRAVCKKLCLAQREAKLDAWREMVRREQFPNKKCKIAIVGKYIQLQDAYLSIVESLKHAGIANDARGDWNGCGRGCDGRKRRNASRGCGRRAHPGRLWHARARGKNCRSAVCAGKRRADAWNLPRHANGGGGICAQRIGICGCAFFGG